MCAIQLSDGHGWQVQVTSAAVGNTEAYSCAGDRRRVVGLLQQFSYRFRVRRHTAHRGKPPHSATLAAVGNHFSYLAARGATFAGR